MGLSKAAASKRYSRLGKAVEEWQKGVTKEKNDSEDSEKQPEAKEEMEETDEEVKHEENGQEVNQEEEDA